MDYPKDPKDCVGDEVEDFEECLKLALKDFPDLKGVSTGAIASTYQFNRVGVICDRLGMTSLALMWKRD